VAPGGLVRRLIALGYELAEERPCRVAPGGGAALPSGSGRRSGPAEWLRAAERPCRVAPGGLVRRFIALGYELAAERP